MPPTRLQRSGATLDELRAAVRAEFGPGARIVAAERVTTPGIGGLFRKAHVEGTVEVPAPDDQVVARVAIADGPVQRIGIAALLADADAAEARIAGRDGTASTRADAFASVLDGFVADGVARPAARSTGAVGPGGAAASAGAVGSAGAAGPAASVAVGPAAGPAVDEPADAAVLASGVVSDLSATAPGVAGTRPGGAHHLLDAAADPRLVAPTVPRPPAPSVRSADGDLVLLVGRPNDVDAAAGLFAVRHALRPTAAADRRTGILARAEGVRDGHAVLAVAAWDDAATIDGLAADQVWLVVDAGRKPEDAAAMLAAVAQRAPVGGVVSIGERETATPESVHLLGLPVVSLG